MNPRRGKGKDSKNMKRVGIISYPTLFTALLLGLAWAIRGHFGHEWGAAWAGAIGALALIVASGRSDWWRAAPVLALLGAVGWGAGGMMSYGIVVGYCRGTDFANVAYGYAMLAVIGGLYGLIGGGMLGLGLETTSQKRPDWAALLAQMLALGFLSWGFLIYQLELFMTPPRSELWAGCLGAGLALLWYLHRNGYHAALRVAVFSCFGAGAGFALGNFFQSLGIASGLAYNWWNVMEFTLGFLGGLGMAYGVVSSKWPQRARPAAASNWAALLLLFLLIPLFNFYAAFSTEKLARLAQNLQLQQADAFVHTQQGAGWLLMLLFAAGACWLWWQYARQDQQWGWQVPGLLFACVLYYTLFGYVVKGVFYQPYSLAQSTTLYLPIVLGAGLWWWWRKTYSLPLSDEPQAPLRPATALRLLLLWLLLVAVTAGITVWGGLGVEDAHQRF
ncbi:MAG: hypothetical protein D6730_14225 [Bacteroidetes bacterium]|nr:MAG: hypothetical protein D6730_14225 [Bacteroidota bacterium]